MFFSDSEMSGVEEMGKRRRKPLANKSDSFINPFDYVQDYYFDFLHI